MNNLFQDFLDNSSMNEAHKIGTKVEIVKGSAKGTVGHIGEIRHGAYSGAPKTYTVYHGEHGATQVPKEHLRAVKEEVEEIEEADNLALRGLHTANPQSIPSYMRSTEKGKKSLADKNKTVLKDLIKRQLGKHPKATLPEEVELDEAGAFSYGAKLPRKGSVAYNAMMKRKEQEKNQKPIEPKDQMVGTAKVVKEENQYMSKIEGGKGKGKGFGDKSATVDDHLSAMNYHSGEYQKAMKEKRDSDARHHGMKYHKHKDQIERLGDVGNYRKESVELDEAKSAADYEEIAKKHVADGQKGTRANMVYASKMAGRARRAAEILKKGGSHEDAFKHYQGTISEALDTHEQAMAHKKQADAAMDKNDLESYHAHMSAHHESMGQWHESKGRQGNADKEYEKAEKHHELGVKKATQKNEEVELDKEQIDELSKTTLGSYIKKRSHDVATQGAVTRQFAVNAAKEKEAQGGYSTRSVRDLEGRTDRAFAKGWKYRQNIGKAVDRLTKEEVDLDEAVSVEHNRYMRSHGKKASGSGNWVFTHKLFGDVDHENSKEVHQTRGSFGDAAKSAKKWAKSQGHSTVYVMEGVEELGDVSEALTALQPGRYGGMDVVHKATGKRIGGVAERGNRPGIYVGIHGSGQSPDQQKEFKSQSAAHEWVRDRQAKQIKGTRQLIKATKSVKESELEEKTLTPAELKKREEIAKAMERKNPNMDKSRKMAIATSVAKRVAEQYDDAE